MSEAADEPSPPREEPFDLSRIRTRSLSGRRNLVDLSHFAALVDPSASVAEFLDSLPDVLAVRSLRAVAGHVARAHRGGHGVALALGGHVVKTGCNPIVLDLIRRGIVTSLHMAGSTAIHDYEIARVGETSEDVEASLADGTYGMADETGEVFAAQSRRAVDEGIGLGRALGLSVLEDGLAHKDMSLLAEAARRGLPCTVHVALGTDTVHVHPDADGATIGGATHIDFQLACTVVSKLDDGVWINVGSAVVLPEVLLKCVTVARNAGHPLGNLTTANFDMLRHYRTTTNVVKRPAAQGYNVIGHHELLLPLFRMAVLRELER